ncbi:MAG: 4Fe-4S ferredoxin [Marinilabiliales bacterium]|nr:MAG: 4Fe-4S ferredoxin [Marinilabiliales bacterium]
MKRQIIKIDEELCNGCGACIPNCHEGALQIIDGKARLISDLMCDGLGACIGHCPLGAISIEERVAEAYNETEVISGMIAKGENTIFAHLKHLKDHKEFGYMKEGVKYLNDHREELGFDFDNVLQRLADEEMPKGEPSGDSCATGGCPGSAAKDFSQIEIDPNKSVPATGDLSSALSHWPVQMHLINPGSSHFRKTDLLIAADCTAFTAGGFHSEYLKGKTLAIACPKLDSGLDSYTDKIRRLIDEAEVNTITAMIMEVPCCGGLLEIIKRAMAEATRKIPVKVIVIGIRGNKISENWMMF